MKKKWKGLVLCFAICVFAFLCAQSVEAASTKTVTGTCMYDEAYEVLDIVNKKRINQGLGKLTMDEDLLAAAMLRAAEITVTFNHIRPNGSAWSSACDKVYAENIAYGQGSASEVMTSWMNSGGHKTNIMNKEYNSIGVGCFKLNGTMYWVQCFGYCKADKVSQPSNAKKTYKVSMTSGVETKLINPLSSKVSGFTATAGKKKLTIKWKKKTGIDGYQLQISTSKSFKNKESYTLGKSATQKVIKKYNGIKLKSKKRYYVRIRAFIKNKDAQGNTVKKYSKWKTINKKVK